MIQKTIVLLILIFGININAQELPKILPLSPNAASIAKYGEIPIGYFTGTPNINIPIYTIETKELNLPLVLNYHSGGNKVEAIASWVGLGWSLNTIPSISRNVRGIPDEETGGYFSKFRGKTVYELYQENDSGVNTSNYDAFRTYLFTGEVDSEPDIFYYNLPRESGKFFYNQESNKFITYPKSNIKITREGLNYRLVTQDGTEYVLDIKETTAFIGSTPLPPTTSSWYASKIISASKQDTISLDYAIENQRYSTNTVTTKYQFLSGSTQVGTPPNNNESIRTLNQIKAQVLSQISFNGGYIKFKRNNTQRNDLEGSYHLDNISVYNYNNKLIRKYEFTYNYIQGTTCSGENNYENNWMLLNRLNQIENIASDSGNVLQHQFFYKTSIRPPCRNSPAQDYWGYYNGHDTNKNLIPTVSIPNSNPPRQIQGANREVNISKSQFAILQKIKYPTGGYTEFDFENNAVAPGDLPPKYTIDIGAIEGLGDVDGQVIPTTAYFEETFSINNPKDSFLNNNNPNGGAFVDFVIGSPGCDLSAGANTCALFKVIGTSSSNSHINYTRHLANSRTYLPNGNYKITAQFNQDPPKYENFFFLAQWNKIDQTPNQVSYAGGLRIKEIRNFPNSLPSTQPIIKKYKYTTDYESIISSGDVFSQPNFSYSEPIIWENTDALSNGVNSAVFLRIRSASNIQQVNHSGSYVGYKNVIEETNNTEETGYSMYKFSHMRDINFGKFPYPPAQSEELLRGQLLKETRYKKSGDTFIPVQKRILEYTGQSYDQSGTLYPVYSFALKWGNGVLKNLWDPLINRAQVLTEYDVSGGWNDVSKETIVNYYQNDSVQKITQFYYDNTKHLNRTRTKVINSDGTLLTSILKYPQDIVNPSLAVTSLINQNRLTEPIEVETNSNGKLQKVFTVYKDWGDNLVLPEFVRTMKGAITTANSLEDRVVYHKYDDKGNPLEVSKADGTHTVYIWGYQQQYPIAKIENTTYTEVSGYMADLQAKSDTDTDNCRATDCKEQQLRNALQTLRGGLPNAMVITYTYDPLIGVTSITDPKGYTVYYEYDGFQRLKSVKDADGNLVSENKYNYKN